MKLAIASLLAGTAVASSIRADSKVGKSILDRARRLDGGNDKAAWVAGYSLKFHQCATTTDYYGGYFGGNNNNNNNNNNNRNNYNGVYEQRLVHFKLCPSDSCGSSGCSGGRGADYVMDMNEFVQAWMEYKVEMQEAECESVKENCYCENANDDDACEAQCYISAGIYDQCVEQDNQNNNGNNQNGQQFELQDALECSKLEVDENAAQYYNYQNNGNGDGNNYYNYNQDQDQEMEFFVGPYCSSNGKSIVLGVFLDEVCSYAAPDGIYEKLNYGNTLPYSTESIISNECISCKQVDENNGNNGNDDNNQNYNYNNGNENNNYNYNYNQEEPEVNEFCGRVYEDAGKCETNLAEYGVWPNTLACDFIKGLNPWGKTRITGSLTRATKSVTPSVLAGVFAVTTAAFAGVAYYLHKKVRTSEVGLVDGQGVPYE